MEIFEKIASDLSQKKNVITLSKGLLKNFSLNSKNDLESLKNLAFWLYIYNKKEDSIEICSIVKDYEFNNNFDLWTWIEYITALYSRLLREFNDIESSKIYSDKILQTYANDKKLLNRLLSGKGLYDEKIQLYEAENDIKNANIWRFLQFNKLCLIRELGGSDILPIDILEHKMMEIKNILCNS
jgi:hypothetical protein